MSKKALALPPRGVSREALFRRLRSLSGDDTRWKDGRTFSLVFYAGEDVYSVAREAYALYFSENALNPGAFPSLRIMEAEVLSMTASLLGGDGGATGNLTSGGTESILMAVKAARDRYRSLRPDIKAPEIVAPVSAHPAFDKAAHYFDLRLVSVPVSDDFRADLEQTRAAINENTIMLIGSAPSYPQGVLDPIEDLALLAQEKGLWMHVDACVGGFMLPFVERIGHELPPYDFRVPGVHSISVDLHKYGYTAKGASAILYRSRELRRSQYFVQTEWPGGMYGSPTMTGTRPGGAIAAAWAVLHYLGMRGYERLAADVMDVVARYRSVIEGIDDIYIPGSPVMSVFSIASETLNIYAVGDELAVRGWHLDRQQFPASLHITLNHAHTKSMDAFLKDLHEAVARVRSGAGAFSGGLGRFAGWLLGRLPGFVSRPIRSLLPRIGGEGVPKRTAAMYGMMGSLPDRGEIKDLVLDLVSGFTDLPEQSLSKEAQQFREGNAQKVPDRKSDQPAGEP
ncbi:MAG: aspartate aminotransferase family protein [Spirochaetales bacterium]|nr:aspartate aminotransferase family protein [Leptospiraceae bacterium]MCP5482804.1 aspartate aminotransferase family protein [Spirochaetales bacterium]